VAIGWIPGGRLPCRHMTESQRRGTADEGTTQPRRALVIQHVEPENAGAIGRELLRRGVELDVRHVYRSDALPVDMAGHDALIVMGGPMSAYSDDGFPTRSAELDLIGSALSAQKPILGVCLGAQLLARAAGGECHPGPAMEAGWGPIEFTGATAGDPLFFGLPGALDVFHWHSDTFSLPPGAARLAGSRLYVNQVFRVGRDAWGLQCHPEVDEKLVSGMVELFGHEITSDEVEEIGRRTPRVVAALGPAQALVFGRFAQLVVG